MFGLKLGESRPRIHRKVLFLFTRLTPHAGRAKFRSMTNSASGTDWPAWVQAVGSVVAIIAAIWIDQGAARRLRQDRREAARDMRVARIEAVRNAIAAVEGCARHVRSWSPAELAGGARLDARSSQALLAARTVIIHRLQRPGDTDAPTLCLLSLADQRLSALWQKTEPLQPVGNPVVRTHLAEAFDECAAQLRDLIDEYDAGVL
jgi:hypothetical protein